MTTEGIKVFVSSTSEDLKEYRYVARNVVLDMSWQPVMMEHSIRTSPLPIVEACNEKVAGCDLILLLVAFRRGWVPTVEQGGNGVDSITALELRCAREKGLPVLAMLAYESWPGNLWDMNDPEALKWVKAFRDNLNLPAVFFEYEEATTEESERLPAFRAKVRQALLDHQQRLLSQQSARSKAELSLDFFEKAGEGLLEGVDIPFLGTGIYGKGPLSGVELARGLMARSKDTNGAGERVLPLATAAEYHERYHDSRATFLTHFKNILATQEKQAEPSITHDLILGIESLPFVVSATCDLVLERRLAEAGKDLVIVCHILRSYDREKDGKILLLNGNAITGGEAEPTFHEADRVDTRGAGCIVYKPLGSPALHDLLDPEMELDTVVVTETDHLALLGRLNNQYTQIPATFIRRFRRSPLLFLGYALDVWQYRLVMQVFQSTDIRGRSTSVLAVRIPDSSLEEVSWKRLGADMIQMEPDAFAERVLAERDRLLHHAT